MESSSNSQQGFTLIGVLAALIIMTTAVVSLVTLMSRSDDIVALSRQRFAAASLAREGLELTRSIRDTNWFQSGDKQQWLAGICASDDGEVEFSLNPEDVRTSNSTTEVSDAGVVLGEGIEYERVMSVDCSTQDSDPQHIVVVANVQWVFEDQTREVEIREKLYNWFPGS